MKISLSVTAVSVLLLVGCDNYAPGKVTDDTPASTPASVQQKPADKATAQSEHNARISLDWAGSYVGVIPCADCEGIQTEVTLNADSSYQLSQLYLGKAADAFVSQGTFSWSDSGSIVLLESAQPVQFFVGENQLFMLDPQGKRITGELAGRYRLQKQQP